MHDTDSCLSQDILDQIGQGEILPNALRCMEEHVSECESCRELFANAINKPDWNETILPVLREPRYDPLKIVDIDEPIGDDSVLHLLGPTDDPRMLGRIGPYEVMGVVGRGGMGVVFKAFDAALSRFVAIKMLLPHLATSGAARKRFSREGQAAAAVIDDHVLPIFGVDEWQGVPYLVTQYSCGMSLQKRIHDQGALELREILRISLQTARGLAAAHAQGLVHRDVKPSNILLDGTVERALLTDFGLARAVDDASITRSGIIAGTPQFMAPEQARAEAVDQRSDLFSLGAVMYAMCTGRPPFRAESSLGVMRLISENSPTPIQEVNADIPDWLCFIISTLMMKHPSKRLQSAFELAELLEDCLAHVQHPATELLPESVATKAQQRNERLPTHKYLIATGLVVSLFLAGVLIVLELNKGTLTIDSEIGGVPIRLMHEGKLVDQVTLANGENSVRVAPGIYLIEVDRGFDSAFVDTGTVHLQRGDNVVVKVLSTDRPEPFVRLVFASMDGEIKDVCLDSAVKKGQVLLRLRNRKLELQLARTSEQRRACEHELIRISAELQKNSILTSADRNRILEEQVETRARLADLTNTLELLENRAKSLVVTSPIAGTVLRDDLPETLVGRPVVAGQVLMKVAAAQDSPRTSNDTDQLLNTYAEMSQYGEMNQSGDSDQTRASTRRKFDEAMIERIFPQVVRIRAKKLDPHDNSTKNVLATGLLFDERGLILTAASFVDGASQFQVSVADRGEMDASLIADDPALGLAVLAVQTQMPLMLPAEQYSVSQAPVKGIVVAVTRFNGSAQVRAISQVKSKQRPVRLDSSAEASSIELRKTFTYDCVGAPLLTPSGELIGILTGIRSRQSSFAVPIEHALNFGDGVAESEWNNNTPSHIGSENVTPAREISQYDE